MKKGLGYLIKLAAVALLALGMNACISYKKNIILKGDQEVYESYTFKRDTTAYKLRTNDVVYIEIARLYLGDEMYTVADHMSQQMRAQQTNPYIMGYPVDDRGMITIPLVGEMKAEGLTIDQFSRMANEKAREVYASATLKAFLLTQNFSILGEVPRSGRFQYYTEQINVLDAIAMAGGLSDYADRENVTIIREEGDETIVYHLNINEAHKADPSLFNLRNNDVVVINAQSRKRYITGNSFNTVLSAITVTITVLSLVISINNAR